MEGRPLLILDFDGVICDSLPECFVSSWFAYHEILNGHCPASVPRDALERFSTLRPYIRSGEDYLLIQGLLDARRTVTSQTEFDALLAEAGPALMGRYKSLLYEARERLLAEAPEYWCRLNVIYPHMRQGLRGLAPTSPVFILSTKRAAYIVRILGEAGYAFREDHVLYSSSRPKVEIVRELIARTGAPGAVFVDDQVDHFSGVPPSSGAEVDCRLASWGYVRPEWLTGDASYRVISPEEARDLLGRYSS